jgi:hypothetical protein
MPQKWIVENNEIILGNVDMHCDLSDNRDDIIGGGYWWIDKNKSMIYLYGKSLEYGKCQMECITSIVKMGNFDNELNSFIWMFSHEEDLENAKNNSVNI